MEHKLKIGITHGDINGVGYEVILKTLSDPRIVELCTPVVYGSSKVAAYHRKALDLPPFNFNIITSAEQCAAGKINMINCFDDELKEEEDAEFQRKREERKNKKKRGNTSW